MKCKDNTFSENQNGEIIFIEAEEIKRATKRTYIDANNDNILTSSRITFMNDEQCHIFGSYISSKLKSLKTAYLQKKLKRKIINVVAKALPEIP